jgi:hypothetical protein
MSSFAVSPERIEEDERYTDIFDSAGYGTPSSASMIGSYAIASMVHWWANCEPTPLPQLLTDVDDLITVLKAFKRAALADPTIVEFPEAR